jgi:FixJ family two-component response regulator
MSQGADTVYVIDDDASVRKALLRLLRAAGCSARGFATAEEFLGSDVSYASACLVVDVRMPGMSGLDLQQALRAEGRAVPIVFITGYDAEGDRARALAAGAVGFFRKPFDERTVLGAVRSALGRN